MVRFAAADGSHSLPVSGHAFRIHAQALLTAGALVLHPPALCFNLQR